MGKMKCPYCNGSGKVESSFATRLKHLRDKKGVSLRQVGKATGIPYATLGQLETGRLEETTLARLIKLADYYTTTLDYLAGRTTVETP